MMDVTLRNLLALSQQLTTLQSRLYDAEKLIAAQNAAIATVQARLVEAEHAMALARAASIGRGATA